MMKKSLSILLAVLLVVGMGASGFAKVTAPEGVPENQKYISGEPGADNYWTYDKRGMDGTFTYTQNGKIRTVTLEKGIWFEKHGYTFIEYNDYNNPDAVVIIDGIKMTDEDDIHIAEVYFEDNTSSCNVSMEIHVGGWNAGQDTGGGSTLYPVDEFPNVNPDPLTINQVFSGDETSETGNYDVAVAAHIKLEDLEDGTKQLAPAEINKQTITAIVHNKSTDEVEVRSIPSIRNISVTVKNGELVNIQIEGNAKTPQGNMDRYILNIAQ